MDQVLRYPNQSDPWAVVSVDRWASWFTLGNADPIAAPYKASVLHEGLVTIFANGQAWTQQNGVVYRVTVDRAAFLAAGPPP